MRKTRCVSKLRRLFMLVVTNGGIQFSPNIICNLTPVVPLDVIQKRNKCFFIVSIIETRNELNGPVIQIELSYIVLLLAFGLVHIASVDYSDNYVDVLH